MTLTAAKEASGRFDDKVESLGEHGPWSPTDDERRERMLIDRYAIGEALPAT